MGRRERGRVEGRQRQRQQQQQQQLHNRACCTAAKSTQHTRATTQPPALHRSDPCTAQTEKESCGQEEEHLFGSSNPRVSREKCQKRALKTAILMGCLYDNHWLEHVCNHFFLQVCGNPTKGAVTVPTIKCICNTLLLNRASSTRTH